jgi:uncharacterized protein (DUF1800 family)
VTTHPGRLVAVLLSLTLAAPPPGLTAARATAPDDEAAVAHALGRLTFGPRPGDVARVRARGLDSWLEEQLHPERIPDRAVERRLAALRTIGLPSSELLEGYEVPREARRELKEKRAGLGEDPSPSQVRAVRQEMVKKYGGSMDGPPRLVLEELQSAKVLRAVYSERQLQEVLVDFWANHFNVFAGKRPLSFLLGEYERDVIRPHVLGRFEDMLVATAKSPAMLFYLDNWLSTGQLAPGVNPAARAAGLTPRRGSAPHPMDPNRAPRNPQARRRGLNENYAREVMELHTLGVDAGYTQKDVTEVARCFTGWTIAGLRSQDPRFAFDRRVHDDGAKVVLGERIGSAGMSEGERVLRMLARHPATARHLSTKLARRLVADEPPKALVDRAAATFLATRGDLRAVVEAIVRSPEFAAPDVRRAKIKTPFEFAVSTLRAAEADVTSAREVARRLEAMGMPLYGSQPPTGYKDTAEAWVSTSGLLARMNFAVDLAAGRLPGVSARTTREAALVYGAPEFQRR